MTTKLTIAALLAAAAFGQTPMPDITEYVVCPGAGSTRGVLCYSETVRRNTGQPKYVFGGPLADQPELSVTTERPKTITVTPNAPRFNIKARGSDVVTYEIEPYHDADGKLALRLIPINPNITD